MNFAKDKKIDSKAIAERLKKLRIQTGINQKDFAKSININPVQYNRYEKGETVPSTETLSCIADALRVSVDYIYEGDIEDAVIADFEDKELLHLFKEIEKCSPQVKDHAKFTLKAYVKAERHEQISAI